MPRRLMDNLEGEVIDEEVHECALGYNILSADLYCEDALLPNIRGYRMHISNKKTGTIKCSFLMHHFVIIVLYIYVKFIF